MPKNIDLSNFISIWGKLRSLMMNVVANEQFGYAEILEDIDADLKYQYIELCFYLTEVIWGRNVVDKEFWYSKISKNMDTLLKYRY